MNDIFKKIRAIGVVPVVAISEAEKAVPLAKALLAGGIPVAEITFRTAQAEESIRRIAQEVPQMLIGAGTILTATQADSAVAAGAKFLISPGFNPHVVAHCREKGIPQIPGCATPSDMEAALEFGFEVVKFFPAEQAGGLAYIKAVAAPYTDLYFLPTGGISAANLGEYLAFSRVIACGGSWMVAKALIDAGDFDKITRLSRKAAEIAKQRPQGC